MMLSARRAPNSYALTILFALAAAAVAMVLLQGCTSPTELLGRADLTLTVGENSLTSGIKNGQVSPNKAEVILKYIDGVRAAKGQLAIAIATNDTDGIATAAKAVASALKTYAENSQ